jgi:hypothetical protein
MLTDDDLVRSLREGWDAETDRLRYTGRVPTPRTGVVPWTAVPIAAAAAAVLVLPQLGETPAEAPRAVPSYAATPEPPVTGGLARTMVTDEIELAGATFRYRHAEGTPVPATRLVLGLRPPAGARPVELSGELAGGWAEEAWVGTATQTGEAGLFVRTGESGVGQFCFFTAPGIGLEQWEEMARTASDG